jgi:hypothetical protein
MAARQKIWICMQSAKPSFKVPKLDSDGKQIVITRKNGEPVEQFNRYYFSELIEPGTRKSGPGAPAKRSRFILIEDGNGSTNVMPGNTFDQVAKVLDGMMNDPAHARLVILTQKKYERAIDPERYDLKETVKETTAKLAEKDQKIAELEAAIAAQRGRAMGGNQGGK